MRAACLLPSAVGDVRLQRPTNSCTFSLCVVLERSYSYPKNPAFPLRENAIISLFVWLFELSVGLVMFLCSLRRCVEEPAVLGKQSEIPLWTNSAFCEET